MHLKWSNLVERRVKRVKNLNQARSKQSLDRIKPANLLPSQLQVSSAGTHFFVNGLTFHTDPLLKRKWYYNPYFIFTIELLYFTRSCVSLAVPEGNRQYFVYSGDFMYFIRAKTHINITATQYMALGMSILLMNFLNYRSGVKPTFISIFDFMRGLSSPSACGLNNPTFILSILKKAKYALKFTTFNTKAVALVSFILSFVPLLLNSTPYETLLYGLPWSLLFALSSYYTFSCYFWNMTYFFLLCHLTKYRIRQVNSATLAVLLSGKQSGITRRSITQLEAQYVKISTQVERFNSTYWSKYLLIAISLLSTCNNTVFYTALYVDMPLIVTVSLFYATSLFSAAIFFILNTASVVYHESCSTPKVLYKTIRFTSGDLSRFKITSMIETSSMKPIGFYVSTFFIINYFRFYEIFSILVAYFIKIIKFSEEN